jgi:hypothetical protein
MNVLVVYESMYGNTHLVAERIADGLRTEAADVTVVPVAEANTELVAAADLLVVGGPTHVHGMASDRTRRAAVEAAARPGSTLTVDASAEGVGLRAWLRALPRGDGRSAAAFDTRMTGPALLTGRASKGIERALRGHGYDVAAEAHSFLVDHENHLLDDTAEQATEWGRRLMASLPGATRR